LENRFLRATLRAQGGKLTSLLGKISGVDDASSPVVQDGGLYAEFPAASLQVSVRDAAGLFDEGAGEKRADLNAGANPVSLASYSEKARLL
jgi:hypothetical protein